MAPHPAPHRRGDPGAEGRAVSGGVCARCGREAEGFAVIGNRRLCHPDYGPSCVEVTAASNLVPGTATEVVAEVFHLADLGRCVRERVAQHGLVHVSFRGDRWVIEVSR